MARFKKIKPPDEGWEAICTTIRNALTASESVEVVAMLGPGGKIKTEVRAWDGIRKDGSNAEDATEGKDY